MRSIPWIATEYLGDMLKVTTDINADVWAFCTTMWEIFSHGMKPTKIDVSFVLYFYFNYV